MILNHAQVEQVVDRDERSTFVKELVVTRIRTTALAHDARSPSTIPPPALMDEIPTRHRQRGRVRDVPLAMVRKRSAALGGGTTATVLLIHGYGQNRYTWHLPSRSFANYLARAGFDVYNLDLRGHGRSKHLGAPRPSHVTDFVLEDVPAAVEEIRRCSGDRPVYLVGHSLGGLVSYAATTLLQDAVGGVVTLGSPYLFAKGSWTLTTLGQLMLGVDRRVSFGNGALGLKPLGEVMRFARAFIESPLFPLPIRGFAPGSMEPKVLAQHMSLSMDNGSVTVLRNMFLDAAASRQQGHRLGSLYGYAERFERMEIPLLIIAGSKDDLAPPASVKPAYDLSLSPDRTYRTFPRGHLDIVMGRDAPLTIWPLVESWIRGRVRRSAAPDDRYRPDMGRGSSQA
ncbi:alpha/beta hydrolase [Chondromyces apiculatus]|uniref:Polyhydroxyalkanoic acid synthase n=1 Tax=Chondromyces apiculatus DSM 436 TaxID=1192034 RepID=A0A017TGZ4_9BACT|nr:alpha/beta hydrolase [Chondromyces apiculatus]EYF08070.1 Polyhydroxyalkanoic acid synthase [Chondromyces apiculatus DSM 436]